MPSARSVYLSAMAVASLWISAASSATAQTLPASSGVPTGGVAGAGTALSHGPAVGTPMTGDLGVGSPTAIFVARRGWHIDVGFATGELEAPLRSVAAKLLDARYVFFGFGDRRYLMSKHHMPAMIEALWPGRGLILVTGLSASPAEAFGAVHVIELRMSPEQSSAAQDFIWRSLTKTGPPPDGDRIDVVARGPYEGSLYFNARAKYSAMHTCNTWAAEVLGNAGLPVRTAGVVFAGQVWSQTSRLSAAE